jgi:hypothetical protein
MAKTYLLKLIIIALRRLPPPKVDIIKGDAGEQRQQQRATCDDKAHDVHPLGTAFLRPQPQPNPTGAVKSDDGDQAAADGAGCSAAAAATGGT